MTDIIDRRPGGGGAAGQYVKYKDEGDGSFSESQASNLRAWNTSTLTWDRVAVDPSSGRLLVDIPAGGTAGTQYTEGDTDATITGTAIMWEDAGNALVAVSAAKPIPVNIVAGSSSGVQYTEGDTDATITGTAVMWEDSGNALVAVSAAKPLPVSGAVNIGVTGATAGIGIPADDTSPIVNALDVNSFTFWWDGTSLQLARGTKTGGGWVQGNVASGATDTGSPVKVGGRFNSTRPTLTDGQRGDTQLDARGNLSTVIVPQTGVTGWAARNDDADAVAVVSANNIFRVLAEGMLFNGTTWDRLRGDVTNGLDVDVTRVTGTVTTAESQVIADDAAFTIGTSKVLAGGFLADETSTDSVDEGDVGAARMTLDRKLRTVQTPHTAGGLSMFRTLDADETEEDVKTSAGQLYGWFIYNAGAAVVYVKIYNATAANVTVGSTTPVLTIPIPAASAANVEFTNGIEFTTAITIAATTGVGDADTTAPAANQVVANLFYK